MLNLGRRVSYLFWQHPVLWLPFLCVDFTAYWLHYFQKLWTHQLFLWLLPRESVFSHNPAPYSPGNNWSIIASWITLPVVWTTSFLSTCLYVAAFIVTALFVQNLLLEAAPNHPLALHYLQSKLRQLLLFSLIVLILFPVAELIAATPYLSRDFLLVPYSPLIQTEILGAIALTAIGFIMAPSALKLIQPPQSEPIPPTAKMQARIFASIAVAATVILGYTLPAIERGFYNDFSAHWQILSPLLSIIDSLIATFPYIPLSIALSLLALNEPQESPAFLEVPAETE